MGETITLTADDGHGLGAYRARPRGTVRGGLVVIQEIFGVNGHIRGVCDGFAEAGYEVIAPALFDRIETGVELAYDEAGIARGRTIRTGVGNDNAVRDVAAAAAALADAGRVGCVGYCWGGTIAWLAGTRLGLAAAVGYYGSQIIEYNHEHPQCPTMLHYGEQDASTPAGDIRRVRAAHPEIAVQLYPAGHGFNCDRRGDYHAESAALAGERSLAFFAEHLG